MSSTSTPKSRLAARDPFKLWFSSFTALVAVVSGTGLVGVIGGLFLGLKIEPWVLGVLAAGTILMVCFHLLTAQRLYCRVCANPSLKTKGCSKHRRAKRFLGVSYRLQVAFSATFTGRCNCMYCGEPTFIIGVGSNPAQESVLPPANRIPAGQQFPQLVTVNSTPAALPPYSPPTPLPRQTVGAVAQGHIQPRPISTPVTSSAVPKPAFCHAPAMLPEESAARLERIPG